MFPIIIIIIIVIIIVFDLSVINRAPLSTLKRTRIDDFASSSIMITMRRNLPMLHHLFNHSLLIHLSFLAFSS